MAKDYPYLRFASHVTIEGTSTRLLSILDRVGKQLGVVIDVFSAYRSPAYSASVGGYANDPHTRGLGIDANINGQPIAHHPGAQAALQRAGLESGNTPNFYRGKPDPAHVQAPGAGVYKAMDAASWRGGGVANAGTAGATPGAGVPASGLGLGGSEPGSSVPSSSSGAGCLPQVISGVAILSTIVYVLFS